MNTRLRSAAIACTECHVVPSSTSHSTGVVNMTWGTLTRTGGVVPTWTGTTCTNYCHGANLTGGTATAPTWTGTATQAACNSCHGAPPPAPHSTSTACASCHTGYTATTVNAATHLNGTVDVVAMTCTSCHGTSTRAATTLNPQLAAAPPVDTAGNTATTFRGVGAHMKHLSTATRSSNFACTECHTVPTATNHANGTKDLVFGTLARTGGKVPAYNATTLGLLRHLLPRQLHRREDDRGPALDRRGPGLQRLPQHAEHQHRAALDPHEQVGDATARPATTASPPARAAPPRIRPSSGRRST